MPPKHKTSSATQLRAHSRSSSATRIGPNLQFTQKDTRQNDKPKKTHEGARPAFSRASSSQRLSANPQAKKPTGKQNGGFHLKPSDPDPDDDDEWVSSSGAQTPNRNDSDSDTASEGENTTHTHKALADQLERHQQIQQQKQQQQRPEPETPTNPTLHRVVTARQADFQQVQRPPPQVQPPFPPPQVQPPSPPPQAQPPSPPPQVQPPSPPQPPTPTFPTSSSVPHMLKFPGPEPATDTKGTVPNRSAKRQSVTRPPSTHSISSRVDSMRPHPLIRGLSQGHLNSIPKPSPLAPLTVITDPPSGSPEDDLSTSPASIHTAMVSPVYDLNYDPQNRQGRRTSISSARSAATAPTHTSGVSSIRQYDRTRTMSTLSTSASSTALASLSHLPTITRPPSPQTVSFFPCVNPNVNMEAIHPLLPTPYLTNHLTILAKRTPLRESYDRVMGAKLMSGR